jgi:uncharacterized surface protein with fasciclin (FAS1) repeats
MKKLNQKLIVPVALLAVLFFSFSYFTQPTAAAPERPGSIVDVAVGINAETGEFSTLIAAVVAADLVGALDAPGALTVFAPTDAAFAEIGLNAGNINTVPVDALTDILLYHVVGERLKSPRIIYGRQFMMLNGDYTFPSVTDAGVFINDAQILAVDVPANNGVIHVIDSVLLPPSDS